MKSLVVCESMFGNTRQIGEAVAAALTGYGWDARVCDVGDAPTRIPEDVDLFVVGGPTHGFSMSRANTRENSSAEGRSQTGIREWIAGLEPARTGARCAVFDTRFAKPRWLTGSAAVRAAKALRRRGFSIVTAPTSFHVTATAGPLASGELQRARRWAESLAASMTTETSKHAP
jgi:flavodoxin